jgi:hypothetical protein
MPSIMGKSEEEFEAALTAQGMTMEDFTKAVAEQIDPETMFDTSEMNLQGTYRLDGDKLYITKDGEKEKTDAYWVVEVTANSMIVKEIIGEDNTAPEGAEKLLPWTFNKVG